MIFRHTNTRILFKASMLFLLLTSALPLVFKPHTTQRADLLDGVRGACLGVTLGLLFLYFRSRRRDQPTR